MSPRRQDALKLPYGTEGRIIPAGPMAAMVELGDGAAMHVLDPRSFADGGLEWTLRYGALEPVRYTAASIVSDYDCLTSGEYSMKETVRRLRILRRARALITEGK